MELFTVLVGDNGAGGGSGICCYLRDVSLRFCEKGGSLRLTTTPLSYIQPTIVVPVLVAFGRGTPFA